MPDLVLRFLALARGNIKQPAFRAARVSKRIIARFLTVAALNTTLAAHSIPPETGTSRFALNSD